MKDDWKQFFSFDKCLDEAGIDDETIQMILRHADVSTTMAHYVQPDRKAAARGLKKLSSVMQKKYKIKF